MVRLNWTFQALDDLDAICEFIARDVPRYAQIFASHVFDAVDRLETFPLSGRVVPEVEREDIREVIFGNYRIVYRLTDNELDVVSVHHSSRPLDSGKIIPPEA